MKKTNLLVSGAAGLSGSLIIQAMAKTGYPVKAMVRNPNNAVALSALPNTEVITADMLDKGSLAAALEGVDRAILISTANELMVQTQCSFIDAAKSAGVTHIIKFSGEESQDGFNPQHFRYTREHEEIEDYLENSGLAWTHLRPSQFMQVYLREIPVMAHTATLRLPFEQIAMSPVDLVDVAEIAARILTEGGQEGKSLRITGPQVLRMTDIAGIISRVSGKTLHYVPISWEERKDQLIAAGLPGFLIEALGQQAAERIKHPKPVIDLSTHELLGIKPTSFEQFANRHSVAFQAI